MEPFAPLGRYVDDRDQKCGHSPGDSPTTDCPADGTWHIMWNAEAETGFACDVHMAEARARFVFVDSHPVTPDCGMPSALWDFDEKRCVYPDEPAAEVVTEQQTATG